MPQTETKPFADLDQFLDRVGQEQVQAQRRAPFAEYRRLQPKPAPPPPAATSDPYGWYAVPAAAGVFSIPQSLNPPPTPPGGQASRFAFPEALRLPTAPPPPPVEAMGVPPELPATGAPQVAAGTSPAPTDGDQVATIARAISKAEGTDDPNSLGARLNNPGNLKVGDVGYGTVDGKTRFGSLDEGRERLHGQIRGMLSGESKEYTPDQSISEIAKTYTGNDNPESWAKTVAGELGVSPETKLSDVSGAGGPISQKSDTAAGPGPFADLDAFLDKIGKSPTTQTGQPVVGGARAAPVPAQAAQPPEDLDEWAKRLLGQQASPQGLAGTAPTAATPLSAQPPTSPVPAAPTPIEAESKRLDAENNAVKQGAAALDARKAALDRRGNELDEWKARLDAGQAQANALGIPQLGTPQAAQFQEALAPFNQAVDDHNSNLAQFRKDADLFNARAGKLQADAQKFNAWNQRIAALPGAPLQAPPPTPTPATKVAQLAPSAGTPSVAAARMAIGRVAAPQTPEDREAFKRFLLQGVPTEWLEKALKIDPESARLIEQYGPVNAQEEARRQKAVEGFGMSNLPSGGLPWWAAQGEQAAPPPTQPSVEEKSAAARGLLRGLATWYTSPVARIVGGVQGVAGKFAARTAAEAEAANATLQGANALAKAAIRRGAEDPAAAKELADAANAAYEAAFASAKTYEKARKFAQAVRVANLAVGTGFTFDSAQKGVEAARKGDIEGATQGLGQAGAIAFLTALGHLGQPDLGEKFPGIEAMRPPTIEYAAHLAKLPGEVVPPVAPPEPIRPAEVTKAEAIPWPAEAPPVVPPEPEGRQVVAPPRPEGRGPVAGAERAPAGQPAPPEGISEKGAIHVEPPSTQINVRVAPPEKPAVAQPTPAGRPEKPQVTGVEPQVEAPLPEVEAPKPQVPRTPFVPQPAPPAVTQIDAPKEQIDAFQTAAEPYLARIQNPDKLAYARDYAASLVRGEPVPYVPTSLPEQSALGVRLKLDQLASRHGLAPRGDEALAPQTVSPQEEITPNEWAESVAESVGAQLKTMLNPPGRVGELFPSYRGLVHKAVQIARARAAEGLPLTAEAALEQAKQLIESTRPQGPRSPFTKPVVEAQTIQPAIGAVSETEKNAAVDRIRAKLGKTLKGRRSPFTRGTLGYAPDEELLNDLETVGKFYHSGGVTDFEPWREAMAEDIGPEVHPYLPKVWQRVTGTEVPAKALATPPPKVETEGIAEVPRGATERPAGGRSEGALEAVPPGNVPGTPEERGSREPSAERGGPHEPGVRQIAPERPAPPRGVGTGEGEPRVPAEREGPAEPGRRPQPAQQPARVANDYRITAADKLGEGGAVQKYNDNIAAIKLLKQLESENRLATPEEQRTLVKYVGWGMFPQVFDPYAAESATRTWLERQRELQDLLTSEEFTRARASTLNAHYTSEAVVRGMWDAMQRLGLESGRLLEPSMGAGNFFGLMPSGLWGPLLKTGIELDPITGAIARQLYQSADVRIQGFEKAVLPEGFYDAAIGNVPFGTYKIHDKPYNKFNLLVHNYFLVKALDKIRPGGIAALITTKGTMDAGGDEASIRKLLAERADLIGAIRLPQTAFKTNAGTEVTADILFFRKRAAGEPTAEGAEAFQKLAEVPDPLGGEPIKINEYFARHPEMMLGEMARTGKQYRQGEPALRPKAGELADQLREAVAKLPENFMKPYEPSASTQADAPISEFLKPGEEVKPWGLKIKDDRLLQRQGDKMVDVTPEKGAPQMIARIRGAQVVRDAAHILLASEADGRPDSELASLRKALNRAYDAFVKKFGYFNSDVNRRTLGWDPDKPLLMALEHWDEAEETATKADIFTKQTVSPRRPPEKAGSAKEAMLIALNETGKLDFDRMGKLTGKSRNEIVEDLAGDGLIFDNPEGGWQEAEEYLSGNVREKLRTAEAAVKTDSRYEPNVKALQAVQPEWIPRTRIRAQLGSPWVPPAHVERFLTELMNWSNYQAGNALTIEYSPLVGQWTVRLDNSALKNSVANTSTFGTDYFYGHELLSQALNHQVPTARDTVENPDGTKSRIVNQEQTALARQKQQELKDAFEERAWKDEARATELERIFNETFNSTRLREWDGSHLTLPGMSLGVELRAFQKNGIWRGIHGGNTLFHWKVGAGKTYLGVGIAMESKRIGTRKKTLIVVPNHLTQQWSADFLRMYPGAKVLAATEDDFSPENRQKLMSRIATGDWDAVIVGHTQVGKLPVSDATYESAIREELQDLEEAILESVEAEGGKKTKMVKRLEAAKNRLLEKLAKRAKREEKDVTVLFEHLGVDQMIVDESHEFGRLHYTTNMQVAGLQSGDSDKAMDLYIKSQHIQRLNNGAGVHFLTGTPVKNTMVELYTIQKFLGMPALKAMGLRAFNAWAGTFGQVVRTAEITPEDVEQLREKDRFARFFNLSRLREAYRQIADVMLNPFEIAHVKVPKAEIQQVVVPRSKRLESYIKDVLVPRVKDIRARKVDPTEDNMLKVTGDGRKAATDMRLVDPSSPDDPKSKINRAVELIHKEWQEGKPDSKTSLVFLDLSVPKAKGKKRGFPMATGEKERVANLYEDLKTKLIAKGVPKEEIAFIHDYPSSRDKLKLFQAVNQGRIRIVIGSRPKMGAGMNVQRKLKSVFQIDIPWRPMDVEQSEGRAVRPGNDNDTVNIYRLVTEGSFDAYSWSTIARKARFIEEFASGQLNADEAEDIDPEGMILSAETMAAIASGNPLIQEKTQNDIKLHRLRVLAAGFEQANRSIRRDLSAVPERIQGHQKNLADLQADAKTFADNPLPTDEKGNEQFQMTLNGREYDNRQQALLELHRLMQERATLDDSEPVPVGKYRGFTVGIKGFQRRTGTRVTRDLSTGKMVEYKMELGSDPSVYLIGTHRHDFTLSIDDKGKPHSGIGNIEASIDDDITKEKERIKALEQRGVELKEEAGKPFKQADELAKLEKRNAEIEQQLGIGKQDPTLATTEREEGEVPGQIAKGPRTPFVKPKGHPSPPMQPPKGPAVALPHPPPFAAPKPASELVRIGDIARELQEFLGTPIGFGRFRQRALGIFKVKPAAMRLRSSADFSTKLHELAHHLHKFLFGTRGPTGQTLNKSPLRPYRDELGPLDYEPQKARLEEGFAEFTRLYLENPAEAQSKAPDFYRYFESAVGKHPQLADILTRLRKNISAEAAQSPLEQVKSDIHFGKAPRKTISQTWQEIVRIVRNELDPLRREGAAVYGLKPEQHREMPTVANAFILAGNLSGRVQATVARFLREGGVDYDTGKLVPGTRGWEKIMLDVEKLGKNAVEDFNAYLSARTARERMEHKPGMVMPRPKETYEAAIAEGEHQYPTFRKLSEDLYALGTSALDYLGKSGRVPPETLGKIRELHQEHVPLYRWLDPEGLGKIGGGPPGAKGFGKVPLPFRRAKGGTQEILPPTTNFLLNLAAMVRDAELQRPNRALYEWTKQPDSGWAVEEVAKRSAPTTAQLGEIRKALEEAGYDPDVGDPEAVFRIWRALPERDPKFATHWTPDGKEHVIEIKNPAVVQAVNSLSGSQLEWWMKLFTPWSRTLRFGVSAAPVFAGRHFIRHSFYAAMRSRYYSPPAYLMQIAKGLADVIGATPLSKEAVDMALSMRTMPGFGRDRLQKFVEGELARKREGSPYSLIFRHPMEAIGWLAEAAHALTSGGDLATRLPEYSAARDEAMRRRGATTPNQEDMIYAAYQARNVSIDFSEMGAGMRSLSAMAAFSRAHMLGQAGLAEDFAERPKRAIPWHLLLTAATLGLYLYNRKDPDYHRLSHARKAFFWNIRNPFFGNKAAPKWVRDIHFLWLPKAWLSGFLFSTVPEAIVEAYDTKNPKLLDSLAGDLLKTAVPNFIPTALMAVWHWATNKDAFGRPIVPASKENVAPQYQYGPYTPAWTISLGKAIGESPAKIHQWWRDWAGNLGADMDSVADMIDGLNSKTGERPARGAAGVPFVKGFVSPSPGFDAAPIEQFYERAQELEQQYATARLPFRGVRKIEAMTAEQEKRAREILAQSPELADEAAKAGREELERKTYELAKKYIGAYRDAAQMVREDPERTGEQKQAAIRRAEKAAIETAERVQAAFPQPAKGLGRFLPFMPPRQPPAP